MLTQTILNFTFGFTELDIEPVILGSEDKGADFDDFAADPEIAGFPTLEVQLREEELRLQQLRIQVEKEKAAAAKSAEDAEPVPEITLDREIQAKVDKATEIMKGRAGRGGPSHRGTRRGTDVGPWTLS